APSEPAPSDPAPSKPEPSDSTPPPPSIDPLTIDVGDVSSFVVGPKHAALRSLTIDGCGTLADLVPLRGLPAGIEIQLGKSNCLTVERLDGIEHAGALTAFAIVLDVSALSHATQLRRLSLRNGPLPMAGLVALKLPSLRSLDVNLRKSSRGDVQRLLEAPLLGMLDELGITLDAAPALPALPRLRSLDVSLFPDDTRRGEFRFLRAVPNLKRLRIGGVEQADLGPIVALRELDTLDVAGVCRIDARPLAKLPKLSWVTISRLVDEAHKPVRAGLEVHRSNPYALCSPPRP
nr:hypothetical protein [Deltaproteobacteria bacterium]